MSSNEHFPKVTSMDPVKWQLLGDRVLCKRYPEEERVGNIVIPKKSRQNPCGLAWIVACSPRPPAVRDRCEPGDTIFTWERLMDQCALQGLGEPYTCPLCNGSKTMAVVSPVAGAKRPDVPCPRCEGAGTVTDRYFVLKDISEAVLVFPKENHECR